MSTYDEWLARAQASAERWLRNPGFREEMQRSHEAAMANDIREDGALVDVERDPADEYDREAQSFMDTFDAFVTKQFGERCPEHEVGCACCKLWVLRDRVKDIVII